MKSSISPIAYSSSTRARSSATFPMARSAAPSAVCSWVAGPSRWKGSPSVLASWKPRDTLVTVLTSVLAVAVALAVGALFILLSQQNPIDAYRALIEGAFGSRRAIGETLAASTPYIFGGLAFAVAYRAGLFNIGIEGQMIMGGLAAGLVAAWNLDLPKVIYLPMALVVAAI